MPLRLEDIVAYRGFMQPDRWRLHPEDFRARVAWELERQRILDAQAEAIEKKLPEPVEKIPPIPVLKHPSYHLRHTITAITPTITEGITITEKPQSTITSSEPKIETKKEREKRLNKDRVARSRAKKKSKKE